jgi:hypothetical protein
MRRRSKKSLGIQDIKDFNHHEGTMVFDADWKGGDNAIRITVPKPIKTRKEGFRCKEHISFWLEELA